MNTAWKTVAPEEIRDNPFDLIGKGWMLITAGKMDDFNTMTASWGCLGVLWRRPVAVCFVRPTRHTFSFINRADRFTLSFFGEEYRDILDFCGSRSGRDTDKITETGLEPMDLDGGGIAFEQARLVLHCRKLYSQDFDPKLFRDPAIEELYPEKDYHRIFIGEVEKCFRRGE